MKSRLGKLLTLGFLGLSPLIAITVRANPLSGTVAAGSATIAGQGTSLTTINQASDRAIINWQDFSIGLGDVTRFIQPGANAAVLNRVLSGAPSQLLGTLQANGQVFLINPNGILVGPSGQINAASFIGSTLDLADSAFLSGGSLLFSGTSKAGVENLGTINALGGDISLFGHTVKNSGTLNAADGMVGLAAGMSIELRQSGNERIGVLLGGSSATAAIGVDNQGLVQATFAEIKAAGGNIYAVAINNGDVIRAQPKLDMEGGRLVLKSEGGTVINSGTLDASNPHGKGGTVQVLGDKVGLASTSVIDASGATGGGTVLVGGDFQGKNPVVPNASATFVGAGASIKADATTVGNGGKVIIWSDEVTRYYGSISVRGGAQGGNGGFAEISSRNVLVFDGLADVASLLGQSGLVLIDPANVTIQTTGANDGLLTVATITFDVPNTTTDLTLSASAVEALAGSFEIQAHNNLTIANALNLANIQSGESATFRAGDSITISAGANITTAAGGSLLFIASDVGGANDGTASINVSATVGAAATESVIFQNGGTGGINLKPGGTVAAVSLIRFQGTLNLSGNTTFTAGTVSLDEVHGAVDLTINGNALIAGTTFPSTLTANGTLTLATGGTAITPPGNQLSGGTVQVVGAATLGFGTVPVGGPISGDLAARAITFSGTGPTTFGGPVVLSSRNGTLPDTSARLSAVSFGASTLELSGNPFHSGTKLVLEDGKLTLKSEGNISR